MLTIQPAKNLQGKIDLPPDPELFILVSIAALALGRSISVSPAISIPLIEEWISSLEGHLVVTREENRWLITPVTDDPAIRIALALPQDIPWRDYIVFALLGMGKTIVVPAAAQKRCAALQKQAARFGCTLSVSPYETSLCLTLESEKPQQVRCELPEETDIAPLLGLLLGSRGEYSFTVSNPLISPLRTIAPVFGFTVDAKSSTPKEIDPLVRRMQLMQQKKRRSNTGSGQQFTVTADFSQPIPPSDEPLPVTLPGDALAAAWLAEAKCLFPKNSLVISNVPLESWATPLLPFIRKMGCKVSVQETGRTSFGSVGILHIQSTGLVGRKTECIPAVQYQPYLPAMVVIAAFAKGESVLRELADLRDDEPDGIDTLESCIRTLGAHHGEMPDGIVLKGGYDFDGFDLNRPFSAACAGAFAIAGLRCTGSTTINDEQLNRRFPGFSGFLDSICEMRE